MVVVFLGGFMSKFTSVERIFRRLCVMPRVGHNRVVAFQRRSVVLWLKPANDPLSTQSLKDGNHLCFWRLLLLASTGARLSLFQIRRRDRRSSDLRYLGAESSVRKRRCRLVGAEVAVRKPERRARPLSRAPHFCHENKKPLVMPLEASWMQWPWKTSVQGLPHLWFAASSARLKLLFAQTLDQWFLTRSARTS